MKTEANKPLERTRFPRTVNARSTFYLTSLAACLTRGIRQSGFMTTMISKEKAVLERITYIEDAITKAREYLESGKHADWHGFRPVFTEKLRDGKVLSPHKDWVRNVFLPHQEKSLTKAQKTLDRLRTVGKRWANQTPDRTRLARPEKSGGFPPA